MNGQITQQLQQLHMAGLPTLDYDLNKSLPVHQLSSLKTHFQRLQARINELHATVHGYGSQTGPPWTELLTKYNDILQQTGLISEQLTQPAVSLTTLRMKNEAAFLVAAKEEHDNWPRAPQNALPRLLVHPTLPVSQDLDFYMGSFLQTSRPPEVQAVDETAVASLPAQGSDPESILSAMMTLREEHDARAERASKAVDMLKKDYKWKDRPDFAALDLAAAEEEQGAGEADDDSGFDENDAGSEEGQAEALLRRMSVDRVTSQPPVDETRESSILPSDSDDKPLDPDDDLFEEVA